MVTPERRAGARAIGGATTTARVVDPGTERGRAGSAPARGEVPGPGASDLEEWGRTALPVAIDWP